MAAQEHWDTVIEPKDKLLSVDFKELWRYRDLTSLFVKRNIITLNNTVFIHCSIKATVTEK